MNNIDRTQKAVDLSKNAYSKMYGKLCEKIVEEMEELLAEEIEYSSLSATIINQNLISKVKDIVEYYMMATFCMTDNLSEDVKKQLKEEFDIPNTNLLLVFGLGCVLAQQQLKLPEEKNKPTEMVLSATDELLEAHMSKVKGIAVKSVMNTVQSIENGVPDGVDIVDYFQEIRDKEIKEGLWKPLTQTQTAFDKMIDVEFEHYKSFGMVSIIEEHEDVEVEIVDMDDDRVDHFCKKNSRDNKGELKRFKLKDLKPAGYNLGRDRKDWENSVPPRHFGCRCILKVFKNLN